MVIYVDGGDYVVGSRVTMRGGRREGVGRRGGGGKEEGREQGEVG